MCENFCNLHVHSALGSILDGYGLPDRMARRAAELKQPALAITDHGSVSGLMAAKQACEQYGVKFIPGCEFYIAPWGKSVEWRRNPNRIEDKKIDMSSHLTVLAYSQQGYKNLLKLVKLSNEIGFHSNPRIDYEMLEKYNEGLIVTSGCMSSEVQKHLNPRRGGVRNTDYLMVNKIFSFMNDIFGTERYYIELQGHDIPELREINLDLSRINKHYNFPYVVSNDSHYAYPEDNKGQVAVLCVTQNSSINNPNKFIADTFQDKSYYMPGLEYMQSLDYGFDVPDSAFANTIVIADMVGDIKLGYEPDVKKYRFPVLSEYSDDYNQHLVDLCVSSCRVLYPANDEAMNRLQDELNVVKELGFESYFLCVYDIKQFCDMKNIPMTVRGSAGGSIILRVLGLFDFCPLEYDLMFERFLNANRVTAPDVDIDIDPYRRDEVIKYLVGKYGEDYVAQVINVNTIKTLGSIRDAARINDSNYVVGNDMASRIKAGCSEIATTDEEKRVLEIAKQLQGQVRSVGLHAGAVMVSDRPLVEDYPLVRPKTTSSAVTKLLVGVNYETAEMLGGIKLDLLNVDALGIINRILDLVNDRHGTNYTFESIPVDDPISFDVINSGKLAEIFQLSGHTARKVTEQIKPTCIRDVMAINALSRPGPLQYVQLYADRLHGKTYVEYKHPDLEAILEDSQGIMIWQESVMRASQVIAGFDGNEADTLRKAVSKKKGFDKIKQKFIDGGIGNGYSSDLVNEIWDDILHFSGYGFNASHACSYSMIAVKMAYLKGKYTVEFYSAALTGRSKADAKLYDLLSEMKNSNIELLPPKLGLSHPYDFTIKDDTSIVYPYGSIKGVGKSGIHLAKIKNNNLSDLTLSDLKLFKKAGKTALENLALIGAFDDVFGGDRNEALIGIEHLAKGVRPVKQMTFFEDQTKSLSNVEFYGIERELSGLYLTGHPLDNYNVNQPSFADKEQFEGMDGVTNSYVGIVHDLREHRDKNGQMMAFVELEDENYNTITVVVFASLYRAITLTVGSVVTVIGRVSGRGTTEEDKIKFEKYGVSLVALSIRVRER